MEETKKTHFFVAKLTKSLKIKRCVDVAEYDDYLPCPLDLVTLFEPDFSPSFSPGVEAPEELPFLSAFSPPAIPTSEVSMSLTLLGVVLAPSSLLEPRIPTNAK